MLKVIIADDERIQREGILKHISWQDYNMYVAGTAADGIEALELVKLHDPDILITDVKMPKMNGLELSRKAKELVPGLKIIIISGYEEFEFARTAIELNAHAYILKPVNMGKMRDELTKIGSICRSEQQAEEEISGLRKQLEESKPLLVDKFIKDLICGFIQDLDAIRRRAEFLSVILPDAGYCILIVQVEDLLDNDISEERKQLFYIHFEKHLVEACVKFGGGLVTQLKEAEFAVVLYMQDVQEEEITGLTETIKAELEEKSCKTVTMGASSIKDSIQLVNEAHREAEMALRQKFYLGKGKCIFYKDIDPQAGTPLSFDDKYNDLINNIEIGNSYRVEEIFDEIFELFSKSSLISRQYVKAFCFHIMSDIYRILYDMDEKVKSIFGEEDILWSKIYRFDTILDVRQWLKNILTTVTQHIFNKKSKKNSYVVDVIIKTLEERYHEQITIDELSKNVYLTPNYICNIFKESIGESIIDYLTRVRMKHAQKLLADPSLKIYEVAEKTGFNSTSYFSIVFKSNFGISPKDYRDNHC